MAVTAKFKKNTTPGRDQISYLTLSKVTHKTSPFFKNLQSFSVRILQDSKLEKLYNSTLKKVGNPNELHNLYHLICLVT